MHHLIIHDVLLYGRHWRSYYISCLKLVVKSSTSYFQVQDDLEKGVAGAVPIPSDEAGKEEVVGALVANVESMIKADRKITALKQLQVSSSEYQKELLVNVMLGVELTFSCAGSYMANWI